MAKTAKKSASKKQKSAPVAAAAPVKAKKIPPPSTEFLTNELLALQATVLEQGRELAKLRALVEGGARVVFGQSTEQIVRQHRHDRDMALTADARAVLQGAAPDRLVVEGFSVGSFAWYPYGGDNEDGSDARPERVKILSLSKSGAVSFVYEADGAESDDNVKALFPDTPVGKKLCQLLLDEDDAKAVLKAIRRAELTVMLLNGPKLADLKKLVHQDTAVCLGLVGLNPFKEPVKSTTGDARLKLIIKAAKEWADKKGSNLELKAAKKYLADMAKANVKSREEIKLERAALMAQLEGHDSGPVVPAEAAEIETPAIGDLALSGGLWFKVNRVSLSKRTAQLIALKKADRTTVKAKELQLDAFSFDKLSKKKTPIWKVA